jgi:anti-sigma-K factor RskA
MTTRPDNCDSIRELIAAYSIGATDRDETALVEAGLAECPEVAAELAEYLALADEMLFTAPAADAPVRRESWMPPLPATPPQFAPTPVERPRRWWGRQLGIAAVAVAVIGLTVMNVTWFTRLNELQDNQRQLLARLDEQQALLAAVGAGSAEEIQLTATEDGQAGSHATILWNPQHQIGSVFVFDFPVLEHDRAYQLWGVRDDRAFSLGTFHVDEQGNGELVFHSSEPLDSFDALGISTEPAQGSSQPTTPHLVISGV